MASAGNQVYIRGGQATPNGTRYSVVHVGDEMHDPDDGDLIPVRLLTTISGIEFQWDGAIARTEAEVDPRTRVIYCIARVEDPDQTPAPLPPKFFQ